MPRYFMSEGIATVTAITNRLQQAEIIAIINGEFKLDALLEIGDALLAAPILAVEISLKNPYALETISELRQRAGKHLLVGAGSVNTTARLEAALEAEAHFTVGDDFTPALIGQAQSYHSFHLPTVRTLADAKRVLASGSPLFKSVGLSAENLSEFAAHQAAIAVNPSLTTLPDFVKAGAVAVAVDSLVEGPAQPMSAIITAARHWSAAWKRLQPYR